MYYLIKPNLLILYLSHNICHVVWNVRMYQSDWNHITYLPFTGMSKITSLTSLFLICLQSDISLTSPLLICCGMGDLSKPHYSSHASDPMTWIFNCMINTGNDLFQPIWLLVTNKSQSSLVFSLRGKGHDMGSLTFDL